MSPYILDEDSLKQAATQFSGHCTVSVTNTGKSYETDQAGVLFAGYASYFIPGHHGPEGFVPPKYEPARFGNIIFSDDSQRIQLFLIFPHSLGDGQHKLKFPVDWQKGAITYFRNVFWAGENDTSIEPTTMDLNIKLENSQTKATGNFVFYDSNSQKIASGTFAISKN